MKPHAGESGQGFTVVAKEVRKLAAESEDSARQIHIIVQSIQANTFLAKQAIDKNTTEVQSGKHMVTEASHFTIYWASS
ncbi:MULTISPECIES: methyl-accepting chemotaxis protein [unclassified Cohnella]|uniref:methyl-accepting chemotaxis protein n=1 Tax=unclassified Cohnella TaxID=2636738 RepID=UPI0018E9BBA7